MKYSQHCILVVLMFPICFSFSTLADVIFSDDFSLHPEAVGLNGRVGGNAAWVISQLGTATGGYVSNGSQAMASKVSGSKHANVAITRTIDTTDFDNISLKLTAFQLDKPYEGNDFIRVEYDAGDGFEVLFKDAGPWDGHGATSRIGSGQGNTTALSTRELALPAAANNNPNLQVRISAQINVETQLIDDFSLSSNILPDPPSNNTTPDPPSNTILPEPSTLSLFGIGLFLLHIFYRKRI